MNTQTHAHPLNLTMIGTGYVGLVSGTCFAELGFSVTCMDIDAQKIRNLQEEGILPIYEPGLAELVRKNVAAGRLKFTTDLSTCVPQSDLVFIAVGTPQDEDGSADLQYVLQAASDVANHLQGFTVVVNKSTVPVGTGDKVAARIAHVNPAADVTVVSNPEFLREGCAVEDFLQPDRVVVGVNECPRAQAILEQLYAPLSAQGAQLVVTNRASSELIKYAANAFLATKITFINEIASLCEAVGADVRDVSYGMGLDTRIGGKFLQPGPGYGGSCFPKDTHALAKIGQDAGIAQRLVEETIVTNQQIKQRMVAKIVAAAGGSVQGKTVGVLGLAFKAGTDDMREASALTILPELQAQGAILQAFDPAAMSRAQALLPTVTYVPDAATAIAGADVCVILTEWPEFKQLQPEDFQTMRAKVVVDVRNLLPAQDFIAHGFTYGCIGQQTHMANLPKKVAA